MNVSHIPIIMVTAKTGTDDIKEAAGADEYIKNLSTPHPEKIRVDNLDPKPRETEKSCIAKNFSLGITSVST